MAATHATNDGIAWLAPTEILFLQMQAWHATMAVGVNAAQGSARLTAEMLDFCGRRLLADSRTMRALATSGPGEAMNAPFDWLATAMADYARIDKDLPKIEAAVVDEVTEPLVTAWIQPDGKAA
ncbi:hypothetical protein VQ042_07905 [Aurantimonas sp. A2-1-M11]|uniref:hypothetical protein n=1 Tax=Aurantimonas sp. A2-1-M11 TaxID=3113712 RepID=UPI002F922A27